LVVVLQGVSHLRRSGDFWARCPGPYGPG